MSARMPWARAIWYLMALSKTLKVAIILLFWWYVYLFFTPRSPVSRKMPRYLMIILSVPYGKEFVRWKIMMITKCKTKRIKSKSDPTKEITLYFNIKIFPRKNSSTHCIFRNQFSKACSSNCEVYNFIIFEQNVILESLIS